MRNKNSNSDKPKKDNGTKCHILFRRKSDFDYTESTAEWKIFQVLKCNMNSDFFMLIKRGCARVETI